MKAVKEFGLLVIGDETLRGKRVDKHLPHVIEALNKRGRQLVWYRVAGDDRERLVQELILTQQDDLPVFCFGGIGATPDDKTRHAAAEAFGSRLVRHAEAVELLEKQFGEEAYPNRIQMAELPEDAILIPNAYNQVPGFTLYEHHFLPGFPNMAWPMLDWVLEHYYVQDLPPQAEQSLKVLNVRESMLTPLMEVLAKRHPNTKLFSLPHMAERDFIEIGFRGESESVDKAFSDLVNLLRKGGYRVELLADDTKPKTAKQLAV